MWRVERAVWQSPIRVAADKTANVPRTATTVYGKTGHASTQRNWPSLLYFIPVLYIIAFVLGSLDGSAMMGRILDRGPYLAAERQQLRPLAPQARQLVTDPKPLIAVRPSVHHATTETAMNMASAATTAKGTRPWLRLGRIQRS
jgi:hypothetical protein